MKKHNDATMVIAAIVCALTLAVMVIALTADRKQVQVVFTPPPFDAAAQTGMPDVPENLGYGELDAQAFKVSVCGKLVTNGNCTKVWLTNPESNIVWLKLRILDTNGNILGETGLIKPGEYVQSVTLVTVPESGTAVTLKVMAYQPETYYSEGVVTLTTSIT